MGCNSGAVPVATPDEIVDVMKRVCAPFIADKSLEAARDRAKGYGFVEYFPGGAAEEVYMKGAKWTLTIWFGAQVFPTCKLESVAVPLDKLPAYASAMEAFTRTLPYEPFEPYISKERDYYAWRHVKNSNGKKEYEYSVVINVIGEAHQSPVFENGSAVMETKLQWLPSAELREQ